MTQEQKAKVYDEVRDKIAIRFGANVATEIFSQFEMSEDERIRNWLINYFREVCDNVAEKEKTTVLAWLETQGVHANFRNGIQIGDKVTRNEDGVLVNLSQLKRVAKPSDYIDTKKQGKNNMGISEATKQELEDNLNKALEKETPDSWNEFLEKQGEQKPVEWSGKIGSKHATGKLKDMTDKVQKIREEVERLHKECRRKEGAWHYRKALRTVLFLIDTMQEEPVSNDLEEASRNYADSEEYGDDVYYAIKAAFKEGAKWGKSQAKVEIQAQSMALAHGCPKEPVSGELEKAIDTYLKSYWGGEKEKQEWPFLKKMAIYFAEWQKEKDESTTEDLGEYINELSKQFPEVSFAKLSRIAVRVAKWQKENLWKPADSDDLPEYEREVVVFTQNFPNDAGMMTVAIGHRPTPEGFDGKSLTTGEVEHYIPKTYGKGGWNIPDVKYWLDVELPKEIGL